MQIIAINQPENAHLAEVISEMAELGTPTIKAVWMEVYGAWVALEGSHRIAAAKALGLTPEIEEVEYDELGAFAGMDLDCYGKDACEALTELCDSAWERSKLAYTF